MNQQHHKLQYMSQTIVVVTVVRVVVVPVRHGTVRSIVVPRTATFDAVRAGSRAGHTLFVGLVPKKLFSLLHISKFCYCNWQEFSNILVISNFGNIF